MAVAVAWPPIAPATKRLTREGAGGYWGEINNPKYAKITFKNKSKENIEKLFMRKAYKLNKQWKGKANRKQYKITEFFLGQNFQLIKRQQKVSKVS